MHEEPFAMTGIRAASRMAGWAGILVFSFGLPACSSSGYLGYPFLTNRNPNSEYAVQRPTYGPDTGKPFFLGGYAGASYDPLFRRQRMLTDVGGPPVTSQPTVSVDQGAWDND
jgi:hypothetical protein